MTDIPIIFSGPMVRALLDGRKTMTRRLAWREPKQTQSQIAAGISKLMLGMQPSPWQKVKPGDRLWVRENFAYLGTMDPGILAFAATYPSDLRSDIENVPDDIHDAGYKWTPCIHMPRSLSRLTLLVTSTKTERLQDITKRDAMDEGAMFHNGHGIGHSGWRHDQQEVYIDAKSSFGGLWKKLHGADSWDANPEVVALSFIVDKGNIGPKAKSA